MSQKVFVNSFESPMGMIRTAETQKGLAMIWLPGKDEQAFMEEVSWHFPRALIDSGGSENKKVREQILANLDGRSKLFSLKLDMVGTPFQLKVYRQVAAIPYGETRSYSEIALSVGHPNAYRAVGTVMSHNRLPLVIPCHRVVASSGLGGYGGGLDLKKRLLRLEGVAC